MSKVYSGIVLTATLILSILSSTAFADVFCYKTSAFNSRGTSDVSVYKKSCPKGYTAVSSSAFDVSIKTASNKYKGDTGPKGEKGDVGHVGDQGVQGDKGAIGQEGEKGDKGPPGIQGDQGISPVGDQGAKGISGIGTDELFRYSGGSGSIEIQPSYLILQANSVQKTTYTNVQDAISTSPLVGTTCSKIAYFAEISATPGNSESWEFNLVVGDQALLTGVETTLCDIANTDTSCEGIKNLSIASNSTLNVAFEGSNAAIPPMKAHWSIRCLDS